MFKIIFYLGLSTSCLFGTNNTSMTSNQDINKSDLNSPKSENTLTLMYAFAKDNLDWNGAVNYCKSFKENEYSDWMLPTRKELLKIVIKEHAIDNYCSRTAVKSDYRFAWSVKSKSSRVFEKNGQCNVICIRYNDPNQLEKACNDGKTEYCIISADQFAKSNDYVKSAPLYKKACEELNESSACTSLGNLYAQGKGINQNYIEAVNNYKKACDNNDTKGCIFLSQMYQNGEGVEQNIYKSKYYFLLGTQKQNEDDVQYSQISKLEIPKFTTITEKTKWIGIQKNKIEQKYALLEDKMAFCGKNFIVSINDTKATIDQKFKNADKNFEQYRIESEILKALHSDYKHELNYIGYQANAPFSQMDKFANIYLSTSYGDFRYMISWDKFYWEDVNSYKEYLEHAYENIDTLKYNRKINILKGRYSDYELSPSERAMLKKLIQSQNRAKQQELVNKFLKD